MRPLRTPWIAIAVVSASQLALAADGSAANGAPRAEYKRHMDHGVKLYADKNLEGAIAEFEAAYAAEPRASPLIDLALCHKARFDYPRAIAALEKALAEHRATMSPDDVRAATHAVEEMRGLLATVRVTIEPEGARLAIDGILQDEASVRAPIALGPGPHHLRATLDGHVPADVDVTLVSGVADKPIRIALERLPAPSATPAQAPPARDAERHPTAPPTPPAPSARPAPRGFYALAEAGFFFPTSHPAAFRAPKLTSGGEGGLRLGYRVNVPAAFELSLAYANAFAASSRDPDTTTVRSSARLGLHLRLMTPGERVRLVGTLGGGLAHDAVRFTLSDRVREVLTGASADHDGLLAAWGGCSAKCRDASGVDPFVAAQLGLEVSFGAVLAGVGATAHLESARGVVTASDVGVYDGAVPLLDVGGRAQVGYAFW